MGFLTVLIIYGVVAIVVLGLAILGVSKFYLWFLYLLEKDEKYSLKYLLYALLLFVPAPIYAFILVEKLSIELLSRTALIGFMMSSLFGLAIFLLFIHFLFEKRIKNTLITLFMGGVVFLFFAPSAYFTFSPFVKRHYVNQENKAEETLKECNNGEHYACLNMAKLYREGKGVDKDYSKSIEMYKKASNKNNRYATYELGVIYEEGEMLEQSPKESTFYYKKACKLGSSDGCIKLADSYSEGRGIAKDRDKAEAIYFNYCMEYEKDACDAYLDIHPSKSLKRYSTDNGFNGKLMDDPSSWSRAFATPLPKNIDILNSFFKSSYGLCCTRYWFYFKLKMSQKDMDIALSDFKKLEGNETKEFEKTFPKNFNFGDIENYSVYQNSRVTIFVDKKTKVIYLYGYVYIDGN